MVKHTTNLDVVPGVASSPSSARKICNSLTMSITAIHSKIINSS